MDSVSPIERIALPIPAIGAGGLAALAGFGVLVAPTALLEAFAVHSGIAAVIGAAEPPLGFTARAALTLAAAGTMFAFAWVLLDLLGPGRTVALDRLPALPKSIRLPGLDGLLSRLPVPGQAKAAKPTAKTGREPVREPVRAGRDLGVPFLEVSAIRAPGPVPDIARDIPKDLDLPLAHFDPAAMPSVPAMPVPLVPALARRIDDAAAAAPAPEDESEPLVLSQLAPEPRPLAIVPPAPRPEERWAEPGVLWPKPTERWPEPAERWDVMALPTPPVTRAAEKSDRPTEATIQALLDRLERGVAQKAPAAPEPLRPTLRDTLGELRALASR